MRVLFITSHGDSLTSIRPEAELFIGLARTGVEVAVMTQDDSVYVERMRAAGIRVIGFEPRRRIEFRAIRAIRAELRRGRYDILQMFNNKAIANGLLAAIGLPVKTVTYRGQTGNISRRDPSCYLTHLSPRVDRIVCVAESVRQDLIGKVRKPEKLVTIHKGHDLQWYATVTAADRKTLGVPEGAFLVACVANNRPRKGVPVLIEAIGLLPAALGIHFLLIGRGMSGPDIAGPGGKPAAPRNVHCLGYRSDVLELVAACDALVLPSVRREGLPKTVIEAMALAVTPVVTNTGGSPELVLDGETGLVVPAGDANALARALEWLAADRERCRAMGAAARQRLATRFRVQDAVEAHIRLYRDLLQ
jgi:glycosyltransferase involved in cell wall biosynthesis